MPGICLFRRLTGYECPLNGLTRSIYATAHGDLPAAFELNPLFPAYVLVLLYLVVISLRLSTGHLESVDPRPILGVVVAIMALTVIVKLIAGLPMRE